MFGMSARFAAAPLRVLAGLVSLLLVAGVLGLMVPGTARADSAPLDPANPVTPTTVSADALPTVQINGVAWSQVVVGNTVYVAGAFTSARPAGVPAGTQETTRNNLLAYDIRTGQLITSFAPDLNGQAHVVKASPDGSRIYVAGDFTKANGQTRNRVAAYSTATGALITTFRPNVTGQVRALAATGDTVYLGGNFSAVGGTSRTKLAAVRAADGSLLPWAPVPGAAAGATVSTANAVYALVVTDAGQVVAAGRFDTLNGQNATGVGALDPVTGATRPFAINKLLTNQGPNSAIWSLSTDGTLVFGSSYDYYGPGNIEGTFAVRGNTGEIVSINDCHGDTYSAFPMNGALYVAGHPHVCSNIGGYPEQDPRVHKFAVAVSIAPSGVVGSASGSVGDGALRGKPAAALLDWFPTFVAGQYTGQYQAGWSVAGNGQYIVYGGEFPSVNGTAQQGLVRFAVPSIAANKRGPFGKIMTAQATTLAAGAARISWNATYDQDNENLVYRVYRDDTATVVETRTVASTWWNMPKSTFTDTDVSPGSHRYRITATDPFGNSVASDWITVEVPASGNTRSWVGKAWTDGAEHLWSLAETSGDAVDQIGDEDMAVGPGVSREQTGALSGDRDTAYRFRGTNDSYLASQTQTPGPNTFSLETWFQTSSTAGGKIVGFGNANSGNSSAYDRHVYVDDSGKLTFGVYPGWGATVQSPNSVEDGKWHHVVASLSPSGMALYLDGKLVGSRSDVASAQNYRGYWRIGGDSAWSGAAYFDGRIDEVAVYPGTLTSAQVADHHATGTGTTAPNQAPTAAFTQTGKDLSLSVNASTSSDPEGGVLSYAWTFGDGATATGVTADHAYAAAGSYPVTLTVTDPQGLTATATRTVQVSEPVNLPPTAEFTHTENGLTVSVNGGGSSDPENAALSYAWTFGDGATATGVTASHAYAAGGTYEVTLTVKDAGGETATSSAPVTVVAPTPEGQALAADRFDRSVASGWGAAELGGAWTVAGSGAASSVSGGLGHLQVTKAGASGTALLNAVSQRDVAVQTAVTLPDAPTGGGTSVTVLARRVGNTHYQAVFRFIADGRVTLNLQRVVSGTATTLGSAKTLPGSYTPGTTLLVRLDVAGEGTTTVSAKAWAKSSTEPAGWQNTATDDTAALQVAGAVGLSLYASGSSTPLPVRLDVDDVWVGRAGTRPSSAPLNLAPTAAFTHTESGLTVSVDGSGSSDPERAALTYAWTFGDGTSAAGATASHDYTAGGTYPVTLTVTDPGGATSTSTASVTVAPPAPVAAALAADAFARELASGWGSADAGGAWTVTGSGSLSSVSGGLGHLRVTKAGASATAMLNALKLRDVAVQTHLVLPAAPTGTGTSVTVAARRVGATQYQAVYRFLADGRVTVTLQRVVSGTTTTLAAAVPLPGRYTPGTALVVRLDVAGEGTTTLRAKAWTSGQPEPVDWQISATDATAALQVAGAVGISVYLSGSSTGLPAGTDVDNFWVGPAGTRPDTAATPAP
jgi:PKD repeat protein